jgi:transcriptional regulator with XRE-family HTH domain
MTIAKNFATNLTRIRAEKEITQQELAKKAGLSVSYISMLEREQRTPPLDTLEVVAKGLGVDPLALLEDPPKKAPAPKAVPPKKSAPKAVEK